MNESRGASVETASKGENTSHGSNTREFRSAGCLVAPETP